jgi:hypothetical protein
MPYSLGPGSETLNLNPKSGPLILKVYTLHPKPHALHPNPHLHLYTLRGRHYCADRSVRLWDMQRGACLYPKPCTLYSVS